MEPGPAPTCMACGIELESLGTLPIRTGGASGLRNVLLGSWSEAEEEVVTVDIFRCPRCKRLDLYDLGGNLAAPNE